MIITTSYFANIKNIETPVAICGKAPEWFKGFHYKLVAPSWHIFSRYKDDIISTEEYTEEFIYDILNPKDPNKILTDLSHFGDNITLICYESPDKFCHRHIVARWLKRYTGLDIKEL